MDKVGFGIAGCGGVAKIHATAIGEIEDARLVAVYDPGNTTAQAFAQTYGAEVSANYEALLNRSDIQVVNICSPSGTHADLAILAAQAGKHVICEKPLDIKLERVDAMINACNENRVKLAGIFHKRFSESARAVRQAIDSGRLGNLILGDAYVKWYRPQEYYGQGGWRGTWAMDGGGALINQSIHQVDLLQWMFGPVESVFARTGCLAHNIEVEDVAVVALRFKNGAFGVVEGSTALYPGFPARLELHGNRGTIILEEARITAWKLADGGPEEENRMMSLGSPEGVRSGASDPFAIGTLGHRRQIEDMIEAIRTDRAPLVDGIEARKSVAVVLAAYKSSSMGEPVSLSSE